jgi:hypothetical protein
MRRLLLLAALTISFSTSAGRRTLTGESQDREYFFVLDDLWEDVQGSWGQSDFNLGWDRFSETLQGVTAGIKQSIHFDNAIQEIRGESFCGLIDFRYFINQSPILKGWFCDQLVEKQFSTQAEMNDWIKTSLIAELVREFPLPVQIEVSHFFSKFIELK